jgi:hippurate hydrolase
MSVLIGVAQEFINSMETWSGRLILVLQPAEEVSGGAKAMIAAGLFKKFPRPDYNLALHVSADIPSGKIGVIEEWAMANVDSVDITVKGIGGHGAYPHKTIDPIVLSSQIINAIQTIVSREIAPIQPAVVTVGSIHGGTKHNIIPNEVKLQLTIRSYTDEVRNKILSSIKRIARAQALSAGVPDGLLPVINIKDEYTPAVYNDPELTKELKLSFISALEEKNVLEISPVMAGEDFGRFGRVEPKIPTALFWLGAVNKRLYKESLRKETTLPSLHSSKFLPEYEPTIDTGIKAMSSAIRRLL